MNGETKLAGILGWPVAHSKSPAMHNAAFRHLNLNWAYVPLPVRPQSSFEAAVKGLAATGFAGANVTVPYKEEAARLAHEISEDAKQIGAANTLVINDGHIRAENTDAPGFLKHLAEESVDLKGAKVAVIGAGGAARGVIFALLKAGAKDVLVINRSAERLKAIAERFSISPLGWEKTSFERARECPLIVNTTSLGLAQNDPMPWDDEVSFRKGQFVYDLIYKSTPLLNRAKSEGARAINGGGMLLWQGALAFKMWTRLDAPVDIMRRELQNG